jgi:hypothetical protein
VIKEGSQNIVKIVNNLAVSDIPRGPVIEFRYKKYIDFLSPSWSGLCPAFHASSWNGASPLLAVRESSYPIPESKWKFPRAHTSCQ